MKPLHLLLISFILMIGILAGCAACFNAEKSQYEYMCIPVSSDVSLATGRSALVETGLSLDSQSSLTQAWLLGARTHLISRFNELGQDGYKYAGVGMLDPKFNSIWVCFEKIKN